ncbi:hypothetical protein ColKHC_12908 [Colletotrichum higginsianum]|nr:hypothetical protein ColKHC_12908 [Colletotrichum higginsianum]
MFLVGSVSQQSSDSAIRFEGTLYHVVWDWAIVKWEWRDYQWNFRDGQKLYYGGKTTEAKAAEGNLRRLADEWVDANVDCRDLENNICLGFYKWMASHMQ